MPNTENVTYGKPNPAGSIYRAPAGTALPTDATSTLDAAFKQLGYVSDAGFVNGNDKSVQDIHDWSGKTVMSVTNSTSDTFRFTLIEALNDEVLKAVYGDDNVTVSGDTIKVEVNGADLDACSWVVEMIMVDGALQRMVIPSARITSVGDISYTNSSAVGYAVTLTAYPHTDAKGNTHINYIKKA